jgi:oxygen-independent coproporphyrinogen-3 oxidase
VARRLGNRRRLRQYHWGGGTPTYLSPPEMADLHAVVREHFDFEPDAELAVEVDPRVTTVEHLEQLRELGFNRLSMGVQDFTPEVQEIVHRVQPYGETRQLLESARALGFDSVNVDLIYGLPLQTLETFSDTLDKVLELRPERVAVYSYAHMPWLKVQQRRIPEETLPTPEVKLQLITAALDQLRGGGYRAIGMDHFALPEDEMGKAVEDGTLWRNFMGYTVRSAPDVVACGMSGIGDVGGAFFQNQRKLKRYEDAVADPAHGGLAVERGVVLSADDRLRRHVITSLMCTFHLNLEEIGERFKIDHAETFAEELEALKGLEDDGLVHLRGETVEVTPLGRIFVRNIAMVFDQYLKTPESGDRRFSRTV